MAETRSAMPVTQALTVGDRSFVGMDTYTDPNKLQDGLCQRITNLMVQNGSLTPRRGIQGVTTTRINTTGEYWDAFPVKSSRNLIGSAIVVGQDGSGNTRFWKNDNNHTDSLAIPMSATGTLSFSNIQPSLVRMAQLGRYVYVAPGPASTGTSNYPLRIDTNVPTAVITAVIANTNLFTKAGHGLTRGDVVVITAGTPPTGLVAGTPYFVSHVNGNDFYVASALPTSITGGTVVNHITFTGGGVSLTMVTTFKGETIPVATGLITTAPVAELAPFTVRSIQGTAHQTVTTTFALSNSATLTANADFTAGSSGSTTITSWTQFTTGGKFITQYDSGGSPARPVPATGFQCEFNEDAQSGTMPGIWQNVNVPTETYTLYGSSTIVEPACLYAVQTRVINFVPTTGNLSAYNQRGIVVRLVGYASGGTVIPGCSTSTVIRPQATSNRIGWNVYTLIADFRAFKDQLSGGTVQVELQNATDNGTDTSSAIYVDYCNVFAIPNVPKTNTADVTVDTDTQLVKVYGTKVNTTATAPSYGGYLKNRHFYYNVSATTNDWTSQEYVSIQFQPAAQFINYDQSFTIGLQNGSATAITWGSEGSYDAKNGYLVFPLRMFPKGSRNNVKAVYIRCNNDYLVTPEPGAIGSAGSTSIAANQVVFYIGKLVYNGELSGSGSYEYTFARWKAAPSYTSTTSTNTFTQIPPYSISGTTESFFGGVESTLSKISVPVLTSDAESRLRVNLAGDFRDASDAGYTHLLVYRRNVNTFTDGSFRLIAQIDVMPTTPVIVSSSTGVSLEAGATQSQIYLLDNVGDIELLYDNPPGKTGHIYKLGKDLFPQGAETIAVHQSRIWMSQNNTLYASWLLDNDNEYALYTTNVNTPTDPYTAIKGVQFEVSGQYDNEPITALVSFSGEGLTRNNSTSNALLVLRNNSMLPVTGSDASTFTILGFTQEPGAGCIASLCAQTVLGRVWWLSNSGIMQYTGGEPAPVSMQLDRLVNARTFNPLMNGGTAQTINQTLQRQASCVLFDNKFIFSSAQPGGSVIDTMYVFDLKAKGWYSWRMPQFGGSVSIRSMYVLNNAIDAPDLYIAASNGHIYRFTGTQDKETTAGSLTNFTWAVLSRQYGQTYAQGLAYYAVNLLHQMDVHIETDAAQTVDWRIYNNNQPDLVDPIFNADAGPPSTTYANGSYAFTAGQKLIAIRNISKHARGTTYAIRLSGSSLVSPNTFRIYGFMLHVAESGIKRRN